MEEKALTGGRFGGTASVQWEQPMSKEPAWLVCLGKRGWSGVKERKGKKRVEKRRGEV